MINFFQKDKSCEIIVRLSLFQHEHLHFFFSTLWSRFTFFTLNGMIYMFLFMKIIRLLLEAVFCKQSCFTANPWKLSFYIIEFLSLNCMKYFLVLISYFALMTVEIEECYFLCQETTKI